MKFLLLILKNMGRNPLRSLLTAAGVMFLVWVVALVWSILTFLDANTTEKNTNFKIIVSERWQIPSRMPPSYMQGLCEGAADGPDDVRPMDSMCWSYYGGRLSKDASKTGRDDVLFAIAMEPEKVLTMLDDIDLMLPEEVPELVKAVENLKAKRTGLILGHERLRSMNKRVGDRLTIYSRNFRGLDLEFEIVGTLPRGRYDSAAVMNLDYLRAALDEYPRLHNGQQHPLADKWLNLVWLRVKNREEFNRVADQIMSSPRFSNPAVKCETAASGVASFLESFRDLIWGMRWLLVPAAIASLALITANSISISVRERRKELAVLKVLGFRPWQILVLVIGEALLLGTVAGLTSVAISFVVVNWLMGGLKFPIAFFGSFYVPWDALWWGPAVGAATALLGSVFPAWNARSVKVADVFAKVA